MGTVDTMATKTLAEADVSLLSEPAKSQALNLLPDSSDARSGLDGSTIGAQENGVRVSASDTKGLNGDVGGGETRVVDTDISVGTSLGARNRGVSGGAGGFLGDAKVTGGSSSLENGRQDEAEDAKRSETVKGLDSVLGVERNEHNGGEEVAADCKSPVLIGDGSDRKVEFNGSGISLVVEVHGSLGSVNMSGKKCGYDDKGSLAENGGDPGQKFAEMPGSVSQMGKKGNITEEERGKQEMNDSGEENEEDGEAVDEDSGDEDEEEDGEDVGDQAHEFSVGDFVWGKIKSHPSWPGQIYDPSDASEYAAKYNQRDRLLVAYFGDGSFSWCCPSQLEPFAENFEEMSKQSSSKSFVHAVQKALDEIGRLLELQMACSCIPEENRIGLARPLAVNAGIKQGVLMPEGGIGKLSITQHEPAELLAILRYMAQVISITSTLELTVLKSWLSAFYRAKGGYLLAMYHEPQPIEGLEDKNRNGVVDITDLNGPVEVPIQGPLEEDWLSSPVSPRFGQTSQSSLNKCPGISHDKLYQRRKQKSVAELMGEDMDVEPQSRKGSTVKEVTGSRLVSTSGKRRRKSTDEAETQGGSDLTSPSGRKRGRMKKADILGSPTSMENKVSSVEIGGVEGEEDTNKGSASTERKRNKVSSIENDDSEGKDEIEKVYASRERKKSKYLSPPYTSPKWMARDPSSKRDTETESVKIAKVARMGERMTRAAGQLIGSPPIMKCSGETFQNKLSREPDTERDTSAISSPQTLKEDQKIDSMEINASATEVLCEVRSAALNPLYLRENKSLDMISGFVSTFRSSIYLNGSNYKMYHMRRPGRKRKLSNSEPGSLGEGLNQIGRESPKSKSQQIGNERNEQAKSDVRKLKQAARASGMKTNNKESGEKASLPVALTVTFPPGFSLPSKDDLITIFSKFGALNEMETDVLYNSYSARVVFVKSSDAEQAFSLSMKKSPFGAANVNYRLRYSSSASRAYEVDRKASSPRKEGSKTPENPAASQPSGDEASRLLFIRQKLEMMTSMLEKSGGKMSREMKSNLEGEMKGLLQKVSTMAESTSS